MAKIKDLFCMDVYEASRSDATDSRAGQDNSRALSQPGVIPWQIPSNEDASAACEASGKRLCTPEEWTLACQGTIITDYSYGNTYDPSACNGIDTFGRDSFHLTPTGAFPRCANEWGVFDLNGNLWEHVAGGSDSAVRGGAYNCSDSAALHRCRYIPRTWTPSARGFRCCLSPSRQIDTNSDTDLTTSYSTDGGCIDTVPSTHSTGGNHGTDSRFTDTTNPEDETSSQGVCPSGMVPLDETVCMDRYEASRSNATATWAGSHETAACSRAGVLPWYVNSMSGNALTTFNAACEKAGKRLCTAQEWNKACEGPNQSTYFFGNTWDPSVCNSVDTYCQECCDILGLESCPLGENCGYSPSLSSSPYTPDTCFVTEPYSQTSCHVCFHVMPTGAFPSCRNDLGLYDINGNVWEIVPVPTSVDSRGYQVRGGAFNCGSPASRFQCSFNATWSSLYAGFRCCKDR
jgi:formylglycine-generating enzyme required for sulfatase activity